MIYLAAILIIALMVAGRVAHGRDLLTKWLCFAPALLAGAGLGYWLAGLYGLACVLPILAAIVFICDGHMADATLDYMYRTTDSSLKRIWKGYAVRVAGFSALVAVGSYFAGWWYLALIPAMIAPIWLCLWTAKENRHIAGRHERDSKHRLNYELSEGMLAGINGAAVWLVMIGVL